MTHIYYNGGDDDATPDVPVVTPEEDILGPEAGEYTHPEGVPGDDVVDNSQLG